MTSVNFSERAILGFLAQSPGATVQRLAERFELSGSTVANICTRLLDRHLVVRTPPATDASRMRGRPAVAYRLALPGPVVVVQLDGSQQSATLFDHEGEARQFDESSLVRVDNLADALSLLSEIVARLASRHGCRVQELAFVAVAANALRTRRGTLSSSVLPWLTEQLPAALGERLQVPVRIAALALQTAEMPYLDDPAVQTMVRWHVADGVSSHAVVRGGLATGHNNLAGELGHVTLDPQGPRCGCGKRGCLEALVSGPAIHALVQTRLRETAPNTGLDPQLIAGASPRLALDDLYRQWVAGDPFTREFMHPVLDRLAWALSLILNLLDPDVVRVDGYVLRDRPHWLAELQTRVRPLVLRGDSRQIVVENARATHLDQHRMTAYQALIESPELLVP